MTPRPPSPAADRDFRLVWLGTAVSRLGTSVASVALPLVALTELDAGPLTVSLLVAVTWLPWVLFGLPAGAWVDRLAKRPVMVACDVLFALAVLSLPLAAWVDVLTTAHLLVASRERRHRSPGVSDGLDGLPARGARRPPAGARQRAAARQRVGGAGRRPGTGPAG